MKRKLLFSLTMCIWAARVCAQLMPFPTIDSISINKINAAVLVHGDMWWNPATGTSHCFFPNGTQKNISFTSTLWMSGYDAGGQLHTAAQTYRQNGNDYWPGPLDGSDTLTYATSDNWAKIWKVNRTDIDNFRSLVTHDSANTPTAILTWPAVGNTYAAGNGGVPLTMYPGHTYAPFVDINGDGIYQPLMGEYPDVPGDQALWWIFSDNGPEHTETNGRPLGVEIQAMAYAYNRGTLIDNVVYYKYNIINHSANTYSNFRVGLFADMDLGYYDDDFIGYDSSRSLGIIYNGNNDDGVAGGFPSNSYGSQIPIAGVMMISQPMDTGTSYTHAGCFDYYNNDFSVIGNPTSDSQYNYYLRSQLRNGEHFTNDFVAPGTPSKGYGSGPNVNYVFTGDPSDSAQWSECVSGNTPGDRRFIITTGDFTLLPASQNTVTMALVTTNPDSLNGCPSQGFSKIKLVADTADAVFYSPLPPLVVAGAQSTSTIDIYPNPAHDRLFITNTATQQSNISVSVYNTLGQLMNVIVSNNNSTVDVSPLPPGMYYLVYRNGNQQKNLKFIKN